MDAASVASMTRHITFAQALESVRSRSQLLAAGYRPRDVRRGLESGSIRRLQRNRYVEGEVWRGLWPESQHRLEAAAAVAEMGGGAGVLSHVSAAVAWGLPLYRLRPAAVHMTMPTGSRASGRTRLVRHADALADHDVTDIAGVRCTTLERTVFDVCRTVGLEAAISAADAALRHVAVAGRSYDADVVAKWRERMLDRVAAAPGRRGVRQAGEAARLADGRAELPGESVTRLRLVQLGFVDIHPQVRVAGPGTSQYFVDLGVDDVRSFVEFDGASKYQDEALRAGKTLEEVLLAEKRREDWIRGTTQRRFVRVEDAHIGDLSTFAARLAAFGIQPPHG